MKNSGFTKYQTEVLTLMGSALLMTQRIEFVFSRCLFLYIPDAEGFSLDELLEKRNKNSRATLGRLIKELRNRYELNDDLEKQINQFLLFRNRFIHNLFTSKQYAFGTKTGLRNIHMFVSRYIRLLPKIEQFFLGMYFSFYRFASNFAKQHKLEYEEGNISDDEVVGLYTSWRKIKANKTQSPPNRKHSQRLTPFEELFLDSTKMKIKLSRRLTSGFPT